MQAQKQVDQPGGEGSPQNRVTGPLRVYPARLILTKKDKTMPAVTLSAHFDGQQIVLDEPYELQPNMPLTVTVLFEEVQEREDWHRLSAQGLARAYGEDEPEYTAADIKKWNPLYRGPKIGS